MSRKTYNNRNDDLPLQTTAPPVRPRGGGVYRGNQYNYQDRNYQDRNYQDRNYNPYRNNNNNNFYRPNKIYYNRNFQQRNNRYNRYNSNNRNNDGYDNRPPSQRRSNRNRRENRSGSRQGQQQQRINRPRQLRLYDFIPPNLRDVSPSNVSNAQNLPSDFNLMDLDSTANTRTNTRSGTPTNALPQRSKFSTQTITTMNTTQPFDVDIDNNNFNQQERKEEKNKRQTASYRRRQRRIRQQEYRDTDNNYVNNNNNNYNRFSALEQEDAHTDVESNYDDNTNDVVPLINDNNTTKKRKKRIYLEPNRILRYMQDNASTIIGARGNQAYILATTPIYDEWVRKNYDLQLWQFYLKSGTNDKHWAKEVVRHTKRRDDLVNTRFIQKKINRLTINIAQANATISDLQIQLGTYWSQTAAGTATSTTASPAINTIRVRDSVDRLEKIILRYIQYCTQHVKQLYDNKIKLAKAQMEEYKALKHFEQTASPVQWNIHLMLKQKMKIWNTKNKNYQIATKRVDLDLPPKFISKIDFTYKIDETILDEDEIQSTYDQMRQLTKDYRVKAMIVYLQTVTREREIVTNEIKHIREGFPKENVDDEFDTGPSYVAFRYYDELREKRFNLEAEQSIYFLVKQQVEGDVQEQKEIIAPTVTRSLGEDFLLLQ